VIDAPIADIGGKHRTKPVPPETHRFMADVDAAFEQQIFDLAQRQRIADEMPAPVTAAMLYDLVQCPHRPAMDLYGDPAKRDEINAFIQLLWEKGTAYEHEVIDGLTLPILDLSRYAGDEKEQKTFETMQRGEPLIYSARISADDLLGDSDLLRREGDG